jgi:hypothetical protein
MLSLELFWFVALSMLAPASDAPVKVSGERLSVESDGDELRVRSFQAQKRSGHAGGTATLAVPGPEPVWLNVTCIRVIDADTLLIGGFISNAAFLPARTRAVFAVRDGGEGEGSRDFVSALHSGTCECEDPIASLEAIAGGEIEIDQR